MSKAAFNEAQFLEAQLSDIVACNQFLAAFGYVFSWGDGYWQVDSIAWQFQSDILAECQLEAIKHSKVVSENTVRWIACCQEIVSTFRQHNFTLGAATDILVEKVKQFIPNDDTSA